MTEFNLSHNQLTVILFNYTQDSTEQPQEWKSLFKVLFVTLTLH